MSDEGEATERRAAASVESVDAIGQPAPTEDDSSRREVLKKMGRYAAYAPPALLAMLHSRKAVAQTIL